MGLVTINPFLRYKHFWNGTTLSIPVSWLELFTTVINNWCNYADNSLALVLPKLYPYRGIFLSSHGSIEIWMGHILCQRMLLKTIYRWIFFAMKKTCSRFRKPFFEEFPMTLVMSMQKAALFSCGNGLLKNHPISLIKMAPLVC